MESLPPEFEKAIQAARDIGSITPKQVQKLGTLLGEDLARWAIAQARSREKASAHFQLADRMLFTPEALEQCTHPGLAVWRGSRFPTDVLVADITCGIGSDLIALAARGPVVGYELDPERALYARHNLSVCGFEGAVHVKDGLTASEDYRYADPARRSGGVRTYDPDHFAPPPAKVASQFRETRLSAMKLTPLLKDSDLETYGPRLEFVSFGGECREALVWAGSDAEPGRFAAHVESGEFLVASEPPARTGAAKRYLFDPNPAMVRAHAMGHFSAEALGVPWGFLTGDEPIQSPWLRVYRVLEDMAFDERRLKSALKAHGGGQPVLKQRGPKLDLAKLQRALTQGRHSGPIVAFYEDQRKIRCAVIKTL